MPYHRFRAFPFPLNSGHIHSKSIQSTSCTSNTYPSHLHSGQFLCQTPRCFGNSVLRFGESILFFSVGSRISSFPSRSKSCLFLRYSICSRRCKSSAMHSSQICSFTTPFFSFANHHKAYSIAIRLLSFPKPITSIITFHLRRSSLRCFADASLHLESPFISSAPIRPTIPLLVHSGASKSEAPRFIHF